MKVVKFFLILAINLERDGFIEFDVRTTIHSDERVAVKLELDNHDTTLLSMMKFLAGAGGAHNMLDRGIGEDGDVEVGRFFSLAVVPEKWSDFAQGHV